MKTKYDIGDTVLAPCKVIKISISPNGIVYKVLPPVDIPTMELAEDEIHSSMCKEVAEEYNNGWIPCSERFPDDESYILLSFDNFFVPCVGRYEQGESGGAFYIGDDDETCISQDLYVNAWQPLPEPYKE